MTHNFILRKDSVNKQGLHPIRLRLTQDRKTIYISLRIYSDAKFWNEEQERFIVKKGLRTKEGIEDNDLRKKNNFLLEKYNQRIEDVKYDFESQKINFTLNQFKEAFLNKPQTSKFKAYLEKHIEILKETNHVGNANTYAITLKILEQFDKNLNQRIFSEIDIKFVKKLDIWMQKRGNKGNTRMHYHKKVRAIWNMAIADKEANAEFYPYGKGLFQVGQLEEDTEKRYLPNEYLEKLKNTCSLNQSNEFARKVFLLSYYMYGISFRDLALLKRNNILSLNNGEYIVYKRAKTKNAKRTKAITIHITSDIKRLIDELCLFITPIDDYLIPLVTVKKDTIENNYTHITDRRKTVVGWMKNLSKELEFNFNLTSYVSRHTMAMQLQDKAIPENVISQILGHKDMKTTKTYLDSLDTSVIDEAAKVL